MNTVDKIMYLIDNKGVEQKDLAEFLGVKGQTISDWKSGKTQSYKKYIDKIADYFNVTTDYLLSESCNFPNYSNNNLSNIKNVAFGENSIVKNTNDSDEIMLKFIEEFKKLDFPDMVKAMNYVLDLNNKKE